MMCPECGNGGMDCKCLDQAGKLEGPELTISVLMERIKEMQGIIDYYEKVAAASPSTSVNIAAAQWNSDQAIGEMSLRKDAERCRECRTVNLADDVPEYIRGRRDGINAATGQLSGERLAMMKERDEARKAIEDYLSYMGACEDSLDEDTDPLCDSEECAYCTLARFSESWSRR